MKPPRLSRSVSFRQGFSLVELLTTMAILSVVLVFLVNMTGVVGSTWLGGQRQVNNLTKARAMLDLMVRDVQMGVYRNDLTAFPNLSGTLALYTKRPGLGGGRDVSLVTYTLDADLTKTTLNRGDMSISWGDPATSIPFGDPDTKTADFTALVSGSVTLRETAYGVVGFKTVFILADGTLSSSYPSLSGTNPARAIGVTLAVIDDKTLKRLTSNHIQTIRNDLSLKVSLLEQNNKTPKEVWESFIQNDDTWSNPSKWAGYPKGLSSGIKIFERYVPLP